VDYGIPMPPMVPMIPAAAVPLHGALSLRHVAAPPVRTDRRGCPVRSRIAAAMKLSSTVHAERVGGCSAKLRHVLD
jgi:hypothetical protein